LIILFHYLQKIIFNIIPTRHEEYYRIHLEAPVAKIIFSNFKFNTLLI